MSIPYRRLLAAMLPLFACGAALAQSAATHFYSTKTPYQPRQDPATYQAPPAGYDVVYTQLLARHGSRGLSGPKYDTAMLNIWKAAEAEGALTPLGQQLGPDIMKLMRANALLGYGVDGISKPGYGNLSKVGIGEHVQLAQRLRTRLAPLFAQAAGRQRRIVVLNSGVDRARDSSLNFTRSLVNGMPALAPLVVLPPAPAPYPAGAPVAQPDGTDRFTLHFHSLGKARDLVVDPADPRFATYQASQAYQAYLDGPEYRARIDSLDTDAQSRVVGRIVLERLFSKAFVDKIDNGALTFTAGGQYSFTSDDGKLTQAVESKSKDKVSSLADAASMLYNLYIIAPGMREELAADFDQYIPAAQARHLAWLSDFETYYKEGPGVSENNGVTWKIAKGLQDDFFKEVDAIAAGDLGHLAKLRFAHAETIVPFIAGLGIDRAAVPLPRAQTYRYDNNPWRGEDVAPMAANIQWDVLRNAEGRVLVRMLHNERETAFKSACDGARLGKDSYFYDYRALKTCYGYAAVAKSK